MCLNSDRLGEKYVDANVVRNADAKQQQFTVLNYFDKYTKLDSFTYLYDDLPVLGALDSSSSMNKELSPGERDT